MKWNLLGVHTPSSSDCSNLLPISAWAICLLIVQLESFTYQSLFGYACSKYHLAIRGSLYSPFRLSLRGLILLSFRDIRFLLQHQPSPPKTCLLQTHELQTSQVPRCDQPEGCSSLLFRMVVLAATATVKPI